MSEALKYLTPKQLAALEDGNSCKSVIYLQLKKNGEMTQAQLIEATGLSRDNVKQALNVLKNINLMETIPTKYKLTE